MLKKRRYLAEILNFSLFFLVLLIQYLGGIDLSIKNAVPIMILPLITAFAMFSSVTDSTVAGLVAGVCMDSVSGGSVCFNAIVIMLSAVFVYLIANNLFNKNIRSAILLTIIVSLMYFLLKWIIMFAFNMGVKDNLAYLLYFIFPSVLYTTVFILPFYYVEKFITKFKYE